MIEQKSLARKMEKVKKKELKNSTARKSSLAGLPPMPIPQWMTTHQEEFLNRNNTERKDI